MTGEDYTSLPDLVASFAARGDRSALIAFGPEDACNRVSYAELAGDIGRLARGLVARGVGSGTPVLIVAPNIPQWVIGYFAVQCAGGVAVPLDDGAPADELRRLAADSGACHALIADRHLGWIGAMPGEIACCLLSGARAGVAGWQDWCAEQPLDPPHPDPDAVAAWLYTSGTTGTPKAVPLTHRNFIANINGLGEAGLLSAAAVALVPLPVHHAYPFTVGLLGSLSAGATLVFPAGVGGPALAQALRRAHVTVLIGVPGLYNALLEGIAGRFGAGGLVARRSFALLLALSVWVFRLTGMRIGRHLFAPLHRRFAPELVRLACGGAHLDRDVADRLVGLGWELLSGYGLTETAPILTFNRPGSVNLDSAGLPLAGVRLRIADADAAGHGEVQARGPSVFSGYRNLAEETRAAFTEDGWFRTGDRGFIDRGGYLHLVGRIKEMIVLSDGKNIAPEALEDAYRAHPLIADVAVFEQEGALCGLVVPDDRALRARGTLQARTLLRDAVADAGHALPPYRRLRDFRLVRLDLPRTRLGKLKRHLLPALYHQAEKGGHEAEKGGQAEAAARAPLDAADRALLASGPAAAVWELLEARYRDRPLHPDMSPQFDLDLDSLGWSGLTMEIEERCHIRLNEADIAAVVSLRDLLRAVNAAARAEPAEEDLPDAPSPTVPPGPPDPPGILGRAAAWFLYLLDMLLMRLCFRLKVHGVAHLPRAGPVIYAANHMSYLDPMVLAAALGWQRLRQTCWLAWAGFMFAGPVRRLLARLAQVAPVDPDRGAAQAVRQAGVLLEARRHIVWFPEGRRSQSGALGRFQPGIGALLSQHDVPVVPVWIAGSFAALPPGRFWPRLVPLGVHVGAPRRAAELAAAGEGESEAARIADGLRRAVAELNPSSTG